MRPALRLYTSQSAKRKALEGEETTLADMRTSLPRVETQVQDRKSGRLDGVALAKVLGISTPQIAKMIGVSSQSLRQSPASPRIQGKLARVVALVLRVCQMFGGDMGAVRIWLNAPPDLGRIAPMRYLTDGHIAQVESVVDAYEFGQPD